MGAPAPLHRSVLAQAELELRLLLRNPESLIVTMGIPLGALVFFSVIDILPTGRDPVVFLVPGVLAISAMATGLVVVAIQTGFERKYGVLKRLGATPLTRIGYLLAKAVAVTVVLAVQVVAILVVAVVGLGWQPAGAVVVAIVATLVGGFAFAAIGLAMAGALPAEVTLALANAVFLVLLLVSGLAFEAEQLPGSLQAVAAVLPSGALGQVLRAALSSAATIDWVALGIVVAWGFGAAIVAATTFRWEP